MAKQPLDAEAAAGLGDTQEYLPAPTNELEAEPARTAPAEEVGPVPVSGGRRPMAVQKTNTLGDYRLLAKLGEGGMGTVYRARQLSQPGDVALKVLSKQFAARPGFVERFEREGRLMARLDHPHIVRCFAVGTSHGFHYLAMELMLGGSLQGWLDRLTRFSVGDAVHAVLACAEDLRYAHEQGLVHRDVKPDNLLLKEGVVKLADLGLAKDTEDFGLTATGIGIGTPLYAAPEQTLNAKHADARSDIYALGCVLYHFLTGRPPFEARNFLELIQAKEEGKFAPARRWSSEVPKGLDRVLTRMLAQRPEDRYVSCAELIRDLNRQGQASATLSFLASPA